MPSGTFPNLLVHSAPFWIQRHRGQLSFGGSCLFIWSSVVSVTGPTSSFMACWAVELLLDSSERFRCRGPGWALAGRASCSIVEEPRGVAGSWLGLARTRGGAGSSLGRAHMTDGRTRGGAGSRRGRAHSGTVPKRLHKNSLMVEGRGSSVVLRLRCLRCRSSPATWLGVCGHRRILILQCEIAATIKNACLINCCG